MKTTLSLFTLLISFSLSSQSQLQPAWIRLHSSPTGGNAEGWGVDADANENIYWPVSFDSVAGNGYDVACYKLNASGISQWPSPAFIGGTGTQQAYIVNAQGAFLYIGGRTCPGLAPTCDMMIAKIDKATADTVWLRSWDRLGAYDEADGIAITPGGIIAGGWATGTANAWDADCGLWKINDDGSNAFTYAIGLSGSGEHIDGHIVSDGQYVYACGLWNGGYDFMVVKYDTSGNLINNWYWGGAHDDNIHDCCIRGSALYLSGLTKNNPLDTASTQSIAILMKIDLNTLMNVRENITENPLLCYPNPAEDQITIEVPYAAAETELLVFNSSGEIIFKKHATKTEKYIVLNTSSLKPGIYFIHLQQSATSWCCSGKFIKTSQP